VAVATPVRMALRWPPAAAEPLVRDREVLQAEELTHEPNLEVVRIHTHLGCHVGNVGDGNDRVVGHGIPFRWAGATLSRGPRKKGPDPKVRPFFVFF
jgi:hypothetical protein